MPRLWVKKIKENKNINLFHTDHYFLNGIKPVYYIEFANPKVLIKILYSNTKAKMELNTALKEPKKSCIYALQFDLKIY